MDSKLSDLIRILIVVVGQRQNDEKGQKAALSALRSLATFYRTDAAKATEGFEFIYQLTSEYICPPFKATLWPTVRVLCAWSASGVDVLGKCLPSLIAGLKYAASTGEALDSIVELANANISGAKNATLDSVLLDAIKNKQVPLQVRHNSRNIC